MKVGGWEVAVLREVSKREKKETEVSGVPTHVGAGKKRCQETGVTYGDETQSIGFKMRGHLPW